MSKPTVILIRKSLLARIYAKPEWVARLEKIESLSDLERVLSEFAEAEGLKTKCLKVEV